MRVVTLMLSMGACSGPTSQREAELAVVGLHGAFERGLALGLQGFNAADSANIPTQTGTGDVSGTLTVDGQVDQGASDNKGLRLTMALEDYADEVDVDSDERRDVAITYDTGDALPAYDLQLRDMPDGAVSGTLAGTVFLAGDVDGEVELDVELDGSIEEIPGSGGDVRLVTGSIHLTGTATNARGGVWGIDLTL